MQLHVHSPLAERLSEEKKMFPYILFFLITIWVITGIVLLRFHRSFQSFPFSVLHVVLYVFFVGWFVLIMLLLFFNPQHKQITLSPSSYHWSYKVNWGSTFTNPNAKLYEPANVEELSEYMRTTSHKVRVAGSMHSYSPLVQTNSVVIHLSALDSVLSKNETHIRCQAGMKISAVQEILAGDKRTLRGLGAIKEQTLAGGFSTSLSGIEKVAFSQFVTYAKTVSADGSVREWHDLYFLRDSMGLLGIIVELEFRTFPYSYFHASFHTRTLQHLLPMTPVDAFDSILFLKNTDDIHITEFTGLDQPIPTETPPSESILPEFNDIVVGPLLHWFRLADFGFVLQNSIDSPNSRIDHLGADLPVHGTIFLDYRVPLSRCIEFIQHLPQQDAIVRVKLLSPRSDACLAGTTAMCMVQLYVSSHDTPVTSEELVREYGGYSHWGKYYTGNILDQFNTFACYGNFSKLQRELDPDLRFVNDYLSGVPYHYWQSSPRKFFMKWTTLIVYVASLCVILFVLLYPIYLTSGRFCSHTTPTGKYMRV
jgi:hypothetical protein